MNRSREYALVLLEKAPGDLYVLERLATDADAPAWSLGFHAQQAAEKALKAVLAARSVEFPRTHNLAHLLDLVREQGLLLPQDGQSLPRLTPFGATLRYDMELEENAEQALDRTWALEAARHTVEWAARLMG
jgi:HEPN domain-containing protein